MKTLLTITLLYLAIAFLVGTVYLYGITGTLGLLILGAVVLTAIAINDRTY